MERVAFDLLKQMEQSWWYRGRSLMLRCVLRSAHQTPKKILDFGAGWGGMYSELSRAGAEVYAFEPDPEAKADCDKKGYVKVFATVEEALAETYDCISILDVLEHIEDDSNFLEKARGALCPDGALLISVPAFPFLWSTHDVEHQHYRRYTIPALRKRLMENGYSVPFISYWNMILGVPAAGMRILGKSGESGLSLPKALGALLYRIVWIESMLVRAISLPFGTGLVALARKR